MILEAFLSFSRFVTGEPNLNATLAQAYLQRLQEAGLLERVQDAWQVFAPLHQAGDGEARAQTLLLQDAELRATVTLLVHLWYLGDVHFLNADIRGNAEHWFRGLLWPLIHAHPPALSGGYFGHWTYPPDN